MIEALTRWSLQNRGFVLILTAIFVGIAGFFAVRLRLDALPDVTSNQVLVLTRAPGLVPVEVERLVTRPIETALGGVPGLVAQRSLSRYGLASVTAVFADDVDPYRARQVVQERLNLVTADLPEGVEAPELGPLTGGLGEIYHFAVRSPQRTKAELLELVQLRIAPLLRQVPGVVEVNWWGGERRSLEVLARPTDLARLHLTLADLIDALHKAIGAAPGASVAAGGGQVLLRAVSWPNQPAQLAAAIVRAPQPGDPSLVRVSDVADVVEGALPRIGTATANGRGETVYVMVQMLREANALDVTLGVRAQMPKVHAVLPADVRVDLIYDRAELVGKTLQTVGKNLAEGGLLVIAVLLLLLGSLRAGLLVALCIPLSMLGAAAGMVWGDIAGNLMSLGAIDFGLLVDGAVVMVEGLFHVLQDQDDARPLSERMAESAIGMARPVFFSVLVILLVYVPVLSLQGVDGKMFKPMAATVIFALAVALLLSLTFIPAAASLLLRPKDVPKREPLLLRAAHAAYMPILQRAIARPLPVLLAALVLLGVGGWLILRAGTSFVPQLDEGDLVVQTTRSPDVSLESAVAASTRMEQALLEHVPEVAQVISRVGSPEVATDIMGLEQADVFVRLKPQGQWRAGLDRDALIADMAQVLKRHDPGSEAAFTQPIQMRFNELLGGSVTDVDVSLYGDDLTVLRTAAEHVAAAVRQAKGAEDVRILAPPAVATVQVVPDPLQAAQQGFSAVDILDAVQAVKTGVLVGTTYDGPVRIPVRVKIAQPPTAFTLRDLPLPNRLGDLVPLQKIAQVELQETPGLVSRNAGERRLVVGFNVRGAELGDVMAAAQAAVVKVKLPEGLRLEWGGQWRTYQDARARMAIVIPIVLALIIAVLIFTFGRVGPAVLILLNVPFAGVGGMMALALRGLPVSMSAAIGFIALSGIAVLNGVVLMAQVLKLQTGGLDPVQAAQDAAASRLRPVLMTAMVAMLGFVPMMLATGPGAEVQRPLATVVVGGLLTSTALTLVVLPSLLALLGRRRRPG
jgi:cobalt-zinc-cadmium resistance protein CzcA